MSRAGRVLIVGIPNAGKSTLINRLVGKKAAGVGNTPGFTKSLSWIRINKDLELLDSPGILWPKLEDQEAAHVLASLSSIKYVVLSFKKSNEEGSFKITDKMLVESLSTDFLDIIFLP